MKWELVCPQAGWYILTKMSPCPSCDQQNPDEANFCLRCGSALAEPDVQEKPEQPSEEEVTAEPESSPGGVSEADLWQSAIGPSKSIQFTVKDGWSWRPAYLYYQEKFRQFQTPEGPRFALSWHWPAALLDSFLWFLYRKMYMFAFVYAVGPVISALAFGDWSVGIVWQIGAGVSANYLYYWHIKDHVERVRKNPGLDSQQQARTLKEEGGIQPYVLWLGAALHLFKVGLILALMNQGIPDIEQPLPTEPPADRKFL
ncbi:MAG: DUF2628 domain-containing protein [Nitrospirales bacterium]|nr:DUF2628 domain-containing protein [Nitrospira sp.]MDR4500833.1 DUF2628 domain-containing protein [Nitrospirales bacterium]